VWHLLQKNDKYNPYFFYVALPTMDGGGVSIDSVPLVTCSNIVFGLGGYIYAFFKSLLHLLPFAASKVSIFKSWSALDINKLLYLESLKDAL